MPARVPRIPSLRLHKATGQAVATFTAKDFYFGKWDDPRSRNRYDQFVREWLANNRQVPAPKTELNDLRVCELIEKYWNEVQATYVKNGRQTSHVHNVKDALADLNELYGREIAQTFGPLALKAVRERFISRKLARSTINKHIGTIKRMFKWGTENELVQATVYHALQAVSGLRRGRSDAVETAPVKSVPQAYVDAVLNFVSTPVAAMIKLQLLTGMRSGEVVIMRASDIDMTDEKWVYTSSTHKTEHHGRQRIIPLGPKGKEIVKGFLKPDVMAYLFDPRDAMEEINAQRKQKRKTPMTPSQANRQRKKNPKVAPRSRYTSESYRRAVARACGKADKAAKDVDEKAGIPHWHPHQLRHNFATLVRRQFGIDAARAILGHSSPKVTETYAEIDEEKAAEVVAVIG